MTMINVMISTEHLQAYSRFWSYLAGQMFFLETDFRDKNGRMQTTKQEKRGGWWGRDMKNRAKNKLCHRDKMEREKRQVYMKFREGVEA